MNKDFYSTPVVYDSTTGPTEYPFRMNNEHQSLSLTSLSKTIFASRILSKCDSLLKSIETIKKLTQKSGVHSSIAMQAAGFQYINIGDTVRCVSCGLEVSDWTADMAPFTIHKQRSPTCTFVSSMMPDQKITISLPIMSTIADDQNPAKRQKKDFSQEICQPHLLTEVNLLQQIRKRTFSHWPQGASPSSAQMIDAGFFNCNVGDRVMCLYCNIICQQWTRHTDDPCEVHKTLSPKCPYVIAMMKRQQTASIIILNEYPTNENSAGTFRYNELVHTAACHPSYIEIPQRYSSFEAWPKENQLSVDDLVRAGFFYTGTKTIVTCFYCNGSLQNWGANDNPMIEHARWFPNCAYAKQLCGTELYKKIQESKKAQQEKAMANDSNRQNRKIDDNVGRRQLVIPDGSTLSRFVAARLDLPVSRKLLDQGFKMSVIMRCFKDQLQIKHDDFVSDTDLFLSCVVLQKQIEIINGRKENIFNVPVVMNIKLQRDLAVSQPVTTEGATIGMSAHESQNADKQWLVNNQTVKITNCSPYFTAGMRWRHPKMHQNFCGSKRGYQEKGAIYRSNHQSENTNKNNSETKKNTILLMNETNTSNNNESKRSSTTNLTENVSNIEGAPVLVQETEDHRTTTVADVWANLCVLCLKEKRRLACIPCGHFITCISCGHSLRNCPKCYQKIEAFVRIYL